MPTFFLIVILFVLFLMCAFFSLTETAIFAINRYKLRHQASEGNRRAIQLAQWLDEPELLLATILFGSNFANISAATLSATLVSRWIVDRQLLEVGLIVEAMLLTIFILLFCELGPKAIAALCENPLGSKELLDRLAAGAHEQLGQVVEVPVKERAPDSCPGHHLVDRQCGKGALADKLGDRVDDPLTTLFSGLACSRLCGRHQKIS